MIAVLGLYLFGSLDPIGTARGDLLDSYKSVYLLYLTHTVQGVLDSYLISIRYSIFILGYFACWHSRIIAS